MIPFYKETDILIFNEKYMATEETAEEMEKIWIGLFSKFGDENVKKIFFDDNFIETINEGLNIGINMNHFLQTDDYGKIFSTIHVKVYIQAVKNREFEIAENVSTVLEEDGGHLKPLFSSEYLTLVDDLRYSVYFYGWRRSTSPNCEFDDLLSTDKSGLPAYTINHVRELHSLMKETENTYINDALLEKGKDGKCFYNETQMNYLTAAVKEGFYIGHLTEIRKNIEDNNHDTSYDSLDMYKVTKMMEEKFHKMMNQKRNMEELLKMDDKYLLTKETAKRMKESLNEFISEFEKENGYPCYEDDFLEIINEGLDNGINMSPLFRLEGYDYQFFSTNHAKTYIQAIKNGNEDIAKNVSAAWEKRSDRGEREWEPVFFEDELIMINEMNWVAKILGEPGKFDVLFSRDEIGNPAYRDNIWQLHSLVKETGNINIDALLERANDGGCLYDEDQMEYLITAVKDGLSVEPLVEIKKSMAADCRYGIANINATKLMKEKLYEMESQNRDTERGDEL